MEQFIILKKFEDTNSNIGKSYLQTFSPLVKFIKMLKKRHGSKVDSRTKNEGAKVAHKLYDVEFGEEINLNNLP